MIVDYASSEERSIFHTENKIVIAGASDTPHLILVALCSTDIPRLSDKRDAQATSNQQRRSNAEELLVARTRVPAAACSMPKLHILVSVKAYAFTEDVEH
ncbi:hypothetical protein NX059_005562 [Plenodomus lindquistii]|nr:hypothetical protein NX059_005562 [Plenodomus lindquistii]